MARRRVELGINAFGLLAGNPALDTFGSTEGFHFRPRFRPARIDGALVPGLFPTPGWWIHKNFLETTPVVSRPAVYTLPPDVAPTPFNQAGGWHAVESDPDKIESGGNQFITYACVWDDEEDVWEYYFNGELFHTEPIPPETSAILPLQSHDQVQRSLEHMASGRTLMNNGQVALGLRNYRMESEGLGNGVETELEEEDDLLGAGSFEVFVSGDIPPSPYLLFRHGNEGGFIAGEFIFLDISDAAYIGPQNASQIRLGWRRRGFRIKTIFPEVRFRARSRFQSEAFLPIRQAEVVFRARSRFQVFSGHAAEPSGARHPVAGFGVANLETMLGQYHRASAPGGEVRHARSDFTTPPFVKDAPIPGGQDGEQPGLTMLPGERLLAVWQRVKGGGADVVLAASDDDGDTWSEPTVLFEDATNPVAATHPQTGVTLFAARRGSQLVGRVQYPGDEEPRDEFTFRDADEEPLAVAAGSFAISAAIEGASRWVLAVVLAGEPEEGEEGEEGEGAVEGGDFTELVSADDGLTWAPAETDEEPEPEEGEEGEEG